MQGEVLEIFAAQRFFFCDALKRKKTKKKSRRHNRAERNSYLTFPVRVVFVLLAKYLKLEFVGVMSSVSLLGNVGPVTGVGSVTFLAWRIQD